jgi:hypothetical protein
MPPFTGCRRSGHSPGRLVEMPHQLADDSHGSDPTLGSVCLTQDPRSSDPKKTKAAVLACAQTPLLPRLMRNQSAPLTIPTSAEVVLITCHFLEETFLSSRLCPGCLRPSLGADDSLEREICAFRAALFCSLHDPTVARVASSCRSSQVRSFIALSSSGLVVISDPQLDPVLIKEINVNSFCIKISDLAHFRL